MNEPIPIPMGSSPAGPPFRLELPPPGHVGRVDGQFQGGWVIARVVDEAGVAPEGEVGRIYEVAPPHVLGKQPGGLRERVHRSFDGDGRLWPAGATVGPDRGPAGDDRGCGGLEVLDVIRTLDHRQGVEGNPSAGARVSPGIAHYLGGEVADPSVTVAPDPHRDVLGSAMGTAHELLGPALEPCGRPAQTLGNRRHDGILRIELALCPEGAAHIRDPHSDAGRVDAQHSSELSRQRRRRLMAAPDLEAGARRTGEYGQGLDGHRRDPGNVHLCGSLDLRSGSGSFGHDRGAVDDVRAGIREQQHVTGLRGVGVHGGEFLGLDPHRPGGIHRLDGRLGNDHRNRLSHVTHPVAGQGRLAHAGGPGAPGWGEDGMSGRPRSSAPKTATTPGRPRAPPRSGGNSLPWATGLRTNAQ